MTTNLTLQSEPHGPLGNVKSEGVQNQLGRPHLHPLAVLVREATQNCWDARAGEGISVDWSLYRPTPSQRATLTTTVFSEQPHGLPFTILQDEELDILLISDRGTTGLGGPTRADYVSEGSNTTDFVDFLRNVGSPSEKVLGGGTFGYGKASLYAVSRVQTILVYTRCLHHGVPQSRLIGAALGPSFIGFTGRHWWGRLDGQLVEPLLDSEADDLAHELGLPNFKPQETGTTIAIIGLRHWEGIPRSQFAGVLAETILWNMWPKMLRQEDSTDPQIRFSISIDGCPFKIPNPEDWPPLNAFTEAMYFLRARRSNIKTFPHLKQAKRILVRRKTMGWLGHALVQTEKGQTLHSKRDLALGGIPDSEGCHHIALMRSTQLVVRYLEAPPSPLDQFQHGSVFVVTDDVTVNNSFARAEPPTHDDWVIQNLTSGDDITRVRTTLQRVRKQVSDWVAPKSAQPSKDSAVPLGAISNAFGALLTGMPGPGGNSPPPRDKSKRRTRRPRIEDVEAAELPFTSDLRTEGLVADVEQPYSAANMVSPADDIAPSSFNQQTHSSADSTYTVPRPQVRIGRPRVKSAPPFLDIRDGRGVLIIPFEIEHGKNSIGTLVTARVGAEVLGASIEEEPPDGADIPLVVGWLAPDGTLHGQGLDLLELVSGGENSWSLIVSLVDDANVQARVTATAISQGETQ